MTPNNISFDDFKNEVLNDYKLAVLSRECSILGRREVLMGKGAFGIFGDGKELPQIAMAKAFKNGDFRSGYYRDQTFMMAIGVLTAQQIFASTYGDTNIENNPESAGRQMNNHFSTHSLDEHGQWNNLTEQKNSVSDISCTAGQMPRLVGLAQASKIYRNHEGLKDFTKFSINGNEIAWGTIGNASTSEGHFFEAVNAAGVLQIPMIISIWDDEYGISVPAKYQTTKESISEILTGFQRTKEKDGFEILKVKGYDYPALIETYLKAEKIAREEHVPVIIHVTDLMQFTGHSTSGSHERYKSPKRLAYEKTIDCNTRMREWILGFEVKDDSGQTLRFVDDESELEAIEKEAKAEAKQAKKDAWNAFKKPLAAEEKEVKGIVNKIIKESKNAVFIKKLMAEFNDSMDVHAKPNLVFARKVYRYIADEDVSHKQDLKDFIVRTTNKYKTLYGTHLFNETEKSAVKIAEVKPTYDDDAPEVDARTILRDNFDYIFKTHPEVLIFGEDVGFIGDVNQGLEGLQKKYGELRVSDTGIREATIAGQGIGMAMRGLRPIAEIQYLDYILYALQILSDDLATLHYRSVGRQMAPLIIRTRGHRLEGIWHSGSPMNGINNLLKGVCVLVPRNMMKAAGFYNTLLESNDPAVVIENLNGYRLKEKKPNNFGAFKTPIGVVETLVEGTDITVLSYGSTLKLVSEAAKELKQFGISCEVIDAQSIQPFDIQHDLVKSIAKTNRLAIIDEDYSGGASAYLLDEILVKQDAYRYLDSKPLIIAANDHRAAYGTDGDYFSNPSTEDVFEKIYGLMHEVDPVKYPKVF